VEVEVPLFYQGQGQIARAKADMRRQQKLYAATAIRIRASIRGTLTRLIATRDQALYFKTVLLPIRERIVNETQLQFNAMNVGIFQLLQAKRDQVEAARSYVEALRQYWLARAELNQLMAGRLVRLQTPMTGSTEFSAAGAATPSSGGH
jgi:cobalt-zinc-cadmium efflux system outer membrane protein